MEVICYSCGPACAPVITTTLSFISFSASLLPISALPLGLSHARYDPVYPLLDKTCLAALSSADTRLRDRPCSENVLSRYTQSRFPEQAIEKRRSQFSGDHDSLAPMRRQSKGELFSYVDLEARVRRNHPLRAIQTIVNGALAVLGREFAALYPPIGRPSIPPEMLLHAMLLQAFYSIRSERLLMERLEYGLLFRWFVGIGVDDAAWDHSVFSKNRDRLLEGDIAAKFLTAVLAQPKLKKLLSSDHFSVHGTLVGFCRRTVGKWARRLPDRTNLDRYFSG